MARAPKPQKLARIDVTRVDGQYRFHIEDEGGESALYEATSEQAIALADALDDLLADEEDEQALPPAA
jgi:hypothetical protein